MLERQDSGVSSAKRIGAQLLPLQVLLLLFSGMFVTQMLRSASSEFVQHTGISGSSTVTRNLRQSIESHTQHQLKRGVIENLQKLYEGAKLDREYVHQILRDGLEILSEYDTIYNVSMPIIELGEDAEASKKGITVRNEFG